MPDLRPDIRPTSGPDSASAVVRSLLVLRHEPFEHLGYFERVLRDRHTSFAYSDLGDVLDLGTYDGMIVMGGPQSATCGDAATLDAPLDPHAADSSPLARQILEGWLDTF